MCTTERRASCGGQFTAGSSDTRLPPTGKKLYDIHLLGCVGGTPLGTFIWIHLN